MDLVAIGLRGLPYVPQSQFEVVTFEVKTLRNLDVVGVFEALGHGRRSTHSYVLAELPSAVARAEEKRVQRVATVAREHGVGLNIFDAPNDFDTWEEVLPAQRRIPPPEALNDFIENQISQAGRGALVARLAKWRSM